VCANCSHSYTSGWIHFETFCTGFVYYKCCHATSESDAMEKKQMERYKQVLLELQRELEETDEAARQAAEIVELDQSRVGRLSRMDAMQSQAMAIELNRRRSEQRKRYASALRRIERGAYGACATCKREIDPRRLDFDPAVKLCIHCASRAER